MYIILSMILGFAVLNTINAATDGLIPQTIVTKTSLREIIDSGEVLFNNNFNGNINYFTVHHPTIVKSWRDLMTSRGIVPINLPLGNPRFKIDWPQGKDFIYMTRQCAFYPSDDEQGYGLANPLYTLGIRDCICIIASHPRSGTYGMSHVSEEYLSDVPSGETLFEKDFITRFKKTFNGREGESSITLVSACYSPNLPKLLSLLEKHGIRPSYFDFPDIVRLSETQTDPITGLISELIVVTVDKTTTKSLTVPSVAVKVSKKSGFAEIWKTSCDGEIAAIKKRKKIRTKAS